MEYQYSVVWIILKKTFLWRLLLHLPLLLNYMVMAGYDCKLYQSWTPFCILLNIYFVLVFSRQTALLANWALHLLYLFRTSLKMFTRFYVMMTDVRVLLKIKLLIFQNHGGKKFTWNRTRIILLNKWLLLLLHSLVRQALSQNKFSSNN